MDLEEIAHILKNPQLAGICYWISQARALQEIASFTAFYQTAKEVGLGDPLQVAIGCAEQLDESSGLYDRMTELREYFDMSKANLNLVLQSKILMLSQNRAHLSPIVELIQCNSTITEYDIKQARTELCETFSQLLIEQTGAEASERNLRTSAEYAEKILNKMIESNSFQETIKLYLQAQTQLAPQKVKLLTIRAQAAGQQVDPSNQCVSHSPIQK